MTSVYANERWIHERPAAMADAMSLAGHCLGAITRRLNRRRAVQFFERASGRELADIGLARSEALWLTEHGDVVRKEVGHDHA